MSTTQFASRVAIATFVLLVVGRVGQTEPMPLVTITADLPAHQDPRFPTTFTPHLSLDWESEEECCYWSVSMTPSTNPGEVFAPQAIVESWQTQLPAAEILVLATDEADGTNAFVTPERF